MLGEPRRHRDRRVRRAVHAAPAHCRIEPNVLVTATACVRNVASQMSHPRRPDELREPARDGARRRAASAAGPTASPSASARTSSTGRARTASCGARARTAPLVYLDPRPTPDELSRIYPDDYHAFEFSAEQYGMRATPCAAGCEARRILKVLGDAADRCPRARRRLRRRLPPRPAARPHGPQDWVLEGVDLDKRAVAAGWPATSPSTTARWRVSTCRRRPTTPRS